MAWAITIGLFPVATSYPVAVTLLVLAGVFNLAFTSMAQTLVQVHAPAHLRGRLVGLFNMAANGLRAFSGITVGFLGSLIGVHWSLAFSALALLAVTSVLLAFSMRSR
jgi:MFS family permease